MGAGQTHLFPTARVENPGKHRPDSPSHNGQTDLDGARRRTPIYGGVGLCYFSQTGRVLPNLSGFSTVFRELSTVLGIVDSTGVPELPLYLDLTGGESRLTKAKN